MKSNRHNSEIGWVLRDEKGNVLWMGSRKIPRMRSILEVEVEALRWATLVVSNFNYVNVVFETDSKEAADAVEGKEEWPMFRAVIQDIHQLLSRIKNHKLIFQSRESKFVADRIARESLSFVNYGPKLFSLMPNWIIPLVKADKECCNHTG